MKNKTTSINVLITVAYLILIGLLVFNIFGLSDKYNKEEMNMITEVEKTIREALDTRNDQQMIDRLVSAREEYNFDIVISRDQDVIFKTVPYDIGDNLLNRVHPKSVARESQGDYDNQGDDLFIWYSIYRLNDSVFINQFLKTMIMIVGLVTILLGLTVSLITWSLIKPLKNIKKSIDYAKEYEFGMIEEQDDNINKSFKTFVSGLESNISAVSRQHTELEKQLQAKREHLNNIVVVSRSMVHDLKTPVHRTILENESAAKEMYDNDQLVDLAMLNKELNHSLMLDINRILKMLKNDSESFELQKSEVDIISTLMRAINTFNRDISDKGLSLDFDAPEDVKIQTEESTFILLINNLLSNMVLYSNKNTEISIYVDYNDKETTLKFMNASTKKNIARMKDTEQLFNTVKDKDDGYIYSSGNGLYLIKELSAMLGGEYILSTTDDKVTIEVKFKNEKK